VVPAKFGMAKFAVGNNLHQFLNHTEKYGQKFPDWGPTSIDHK
jgi:hypothetical protein